MTSEETIKIIEMLNSGWPQKPLPAMTIAMWGQELSRFEAADVMRVVTDLSRTSEWRPALATILKALVAPEVGESSSEAFEAVWKEIGRVGRGGRPELSGRAHRAVKHLGGWSTICMTWQRDTIHFHRKDFCAEFDDLETREKADTMRALGGDGDSAGRKALDVAVAKVADGAVPFGR